MIWRTVLNRLTHCLMVVTMVLHSILGCCWHHGHAAACASEARRVVSPQVAPRTGSCCHHHHHGHRTPQGADSPESATPHERPGVPVHHDHECSDEACVYVGSKAPELSQPVPFLAFLGGDDGLLPEAPVRITSERTVESPPLSRSSLSSCALLQVWRL